MTLDELYARAVYCKQYGGDYMTLILPKKRPKGFPRGELMCEGHDGKVYSVRASRVLTWLRLNGYPSSGRRGAMKLEPMCADCGGWDIEWMYKCHKHGLEYCRGCACPECADEDEDDYYWYDDGDDEPCPDCGKLP